jgi:hypothetical protein
MAGQLTKLVTVAMVNEFNPMFLIFCVFRSESCKNAPTSFPIFTSSHVRSRELLAGFSLNFIFAVFYL